MPNGPYDSLLEDRFRWYHIIFSGSWYWLVKFKLKNFAVDQSYFTIFFCCLLSRRFVKHLPVVLTMSYLCLMVNVSCHNKNTWEVCIHAYVIFECYLRVLYKESLSHFLFWHFIFPCYYLKVKDLADKLQEHANFCISKYRSICFQLPMLLVLINLTVLCVDNWLAC